MSIKAFHIEVEHATQLGDALRRGVVAAEGTVHSLVLSLGGGEPLGFNGWDKYTSVLGATHDAKAQAKHTTLLYRGEPGMLRRLRAGLPGFDEVVRGALRACPGMKVVFVHVLQQSSAQACFNWHTDTAEPGYGAVRKTMVVLLSNTASSMQIQGEPEFTYSGVGAAALFDSDRVHRSGEASAGTLKIVLFLKPAPVRAAPAAARKRKEVASPAEAEVLLLPAERENRRAKIRSNLLNIKDKMRAEGNFVDALAIMDAFAELQD